MYAQIFLNGKEYILDEKEYKVRLDYRLCTTNFSTSASAIGFALVDSTKENKEGFKK